MSWIKSRFKKWFREQCKEAWYDDTVPEPCRNSAEIIKADDSIIDHRTSYTVRMQPANGGTIIEVSHYDKRQGEYNRDLYIVGDGVDLGEEISKVLVQYKLTHN